jgi:hypothetical protein
MAIQGGDKDPVGNVLSPTEKIERIQARAVEFAYGLANDAYNWFQNRGAKPDYIHQYEDGRLEETYNLYKLDPRLMNVDFTTSEQGLVGYSVAGYELSFEYTKFAEGVYIPTEMFYERTRDIGGFSRLVIHTTDIYKQPIYTRNSGLNLKWEVKPHVPQLGPWGIFILDFNNVDDNNNWDVVRFKKSRLFLDSLLFDVKDIADWFVEPRELRGINVQALLREELSIPITPRRQVWAKFPDDLDGMGYEGRSIFGVSSTMLSLDERLKEVFRRQTNLNGSSPNLEQAEIEITHGIMATNNPTQYIFLPYSGKPAFVELALDGVASHKDLRDMLGNIQKLPVRLTVRRDGVEKRLDMVVQITPERYFMDSLAGAFGREFVTNEEFTRLLCGEL